MVMVTDGDYTNGDDENGGDGDECQGHSIPSFPSKRGSQLNKKKLREVPRGGREAPTRARVGRTLPETTATRPKND